MRMMLGRVVLIGAFVGAVGMVIAQGPIGPFSNVRMRSDSNGALSAASAGACGTLGPLTPGANVPVRSDSSGALQICGTFGGGTPGGADTNVQYNDGGSFGGEAGMTYNETTDVISLVGGYSDGTNYLLKWEAGNGWAAFRNTADAAYVNVAAAAFQAGNTANAVSISSNGFAQVGSSGDVELSVPGWRLVGGGISMQSNTALVFSNSTSNLTTLDTGIERSASGIIGATAGDAGTSGAFRSKAYVITPGAATGVTVNDAGTLRKMAYKVTVDRTAFVCAALTCDVTVGTLPAKARLLSVIADLTQTFACTATCTSSTLSMTLGSSAGGTNFLLSFDADAATAQFGDADAELGAGISRANAVQAGFIGSWSSTTPISLRLTSGTGNIGNGAATNLSQGSVSFIVTVEILS